MRNANIHSLENESLHCSTHSHSHSRTHTSCEIYVRTTSYVWTKRELCLMIKSFAYLVNKVTHEGLQQSLQSVSITEQAKLGGRKCRFDFPSKFIRIVCAPRNWWKNFYLLNFRINMIFDYRFIVIELWQFFSSFALNVRCRVAFWNAYLSLCIAHKAFTVYQTPCIPRICIRLCYLLFSVLSPALRFPKCNSKSQLHICSNGT